jgi:inner membrane transporter RhtA
VGPRTGPWVAPPSRLAERLPAEAWFVGAALSMYAGSALAVGVFDRVGAPGVAWLRLVGAVVVLGAWRRPWRVRWTADRMRLTAVFGVVTASMNTCFYLAIERLPLGTAIEFLGPIAVVAMLDRSRRNLVALAMVGAGVAMVSGVRWEGSASGVAWALASAALWAGYIVFGSRVADAGSGLDGLAVGLTVGLVVMAPVGAAPAWAAFGDAGLLAVCLALGVLSNAVPYAVDQLVLTRVAASRFALMLAILPVTAAVVGAVTLGQIPEPLEVAGIGAVVAALALGRHRAVAGPPG